MIVPEYTGVTIQTPYGPFTVMTEMPIIPTPFGPIKIEKIKKEPEVVPVRPLEVPTIGIFPIALIGIAVIGTILLIRRK